MKETRIPTCGKRWRWRQMKGKWDSVTMETLVKRKVSHDNGRAIARALPPHDVVTGGGWVKRWGGVKQNKGGGGADYMQLYLYLLLFFFSFFRTQHYLSAHTECLDHSRKSVLIAEDLGWVTGPWADWCKNLNSEHKEKVKPNKQKDHLSHSVCVWVCIWVCTPLL